MWRARCCHPRAAQRPTAFVVTHTHHYATVATHLASRGLRVPEDMSLICRSEDPFLQFMRPRPVYYRANMEVAAWVVGSRESCPCLPSAPRDGDPAPR